MKTETITVKPVIPDYIKGYLWSYDPKALDIEHDFKRIITNVLIYGDLKAINWVFTTYSKKHIKTVISDPLKGEWDAKSLSFWSGYLKEVAHDRKKAVKHL